MKKAVPILLALFMSLMLCAAAHASGPGTLQKANTYTGQFTDISPSSWYAQYVQIAYEYGLMSGVNDSAFSPDSNLSVAEALAIACRLHSLYDSTNADFSDGKPWYQPYIDYALENHIISDRSLYTFTEPVTRADFALFIHRALTVDVLPNTINKISFPAIPDVSTGSPLDDAMVALLNAGFLDPSDGFLSYPLLGILEPSASEKWNPSLMDTFLYVTEGSAAFDDDFGTHPLIRVFRESSGAARNTSALDTATAIYRLYNAGVLTGNDQYGTFTPNAKITRSAVATIISRIVEPSLRKHFTLAAKEANLVPLERLANLSGIQKKASKAQLAEAYEEARKFVEPLAGLSREAQLVGIALATRMIDENEGSYSDTAPHYNDPYGYFVLHVASCAGCTRATGMCLNMLGIPYEHVNEGQYTHQWTRVNLNGTYWICDAYGLYCGPEQAPYKHPNV